MTNTLIQAYRQKADEGLIEFDIAQASAIEQLGILNNRLKGWQRGRARFLFGKPEPAPKGLYIYGKVGRGKSMVMDLFYEHANCPHKKRIHFHEFMAKVHDDINQWRKMDNAQRKASPHFVKGAGDDPIPPIAKKITSEAWLLCFDEFQITDIADAMLLGRLFDAIWERQCVVVATSNRHPSELYKNGLNRQLVLPFLERMTNELDILSLDSNRDYRLARLESEPTYHFPLDADAKDFIDRAWKRLTFGATPLPQTIVSEGRNIEVKRTASGCARFDFMELCANASAHQSPLGVRDYLEISRIFHTIMIENIPQMSQALSNEATRFRNLVDAMYEMKTKLIATAEADADFLYTEGTQAFEFERTASRLHEMRSHEYLEAEHIA